MSLTLLFLTMLIELAAGYPQALYRAIGHPVTWIGALINWLERTLNRPAWTGEARKVAGVVALLVLVLASGAVGWFIQVGLGQGVGLVLTALIASTLLAQRSLGSHVAAVATALETEGILGGRRAVSMIVGRDPEVLDEAGIARAAIESLAENFSDGVVAPAFWLGVLGLPGGAIYKAVNTADSMIGHRNERYRDFGWASARFDDLVNLPASRLAALLVVAAAALLPGASASAGWRAVWRDAKKHRSPNAGWPEAAFAGALGLALAGPRSYGGVMVDDVFMGEGGRREATAADIRRALTLYWIADALLLALAGILAAVLIAHG